MTAGTTWLGSASHSGRYCRIRCHLPAEERLGLAIASRLRRSVGRPLQ